MRRALLALVLLLPACGSAHGSDQEQREWRSSAAQAMDFVRAEPVRDETCRQVLRLSVGGEQVRLRLSNLLSPTPLAVVAASAGLRSTGAAARPGSLRPVTVAGRTSFLVPAGHQVTTDPVDLRTAAGEDLLVSFAVEGTATLTAHRIGDRTGWCSGPGTGDRTREVAAAGFPAVGERAGLVVEEVAVDSPAGAPRAVVAAGDSLTDAPLPPDVHRRWPEVLSTRLAGTPVASAAIAGNRLLLDGGYGEPLVQRFERDVLQRSGIGTIVLLAGTNDLARGLSAARVQTELARLCDAAHRRDLRVVLLTIPPSGEHTPAQRAARREVNEWIRDSSPADLVVDADALLRDGAAPDALLARYDSGDGLHLSPAGHQVLGEALAREIAG